MARYPKTGIYCYLPLILLIAGNHASAVTETFETIGFSNHEDQSTSLTIGNFDYEVQSNGSLKTVTGPAALFPGYNKNNIVTLFTIRLREGTSFDFQSFTATNQFEMAESVDVTGYLNGSVVAGPETVTIPWPEGTLSFTSVTGFNNVDEVRFENNDLYFFFENWTYSYNAVPAPSSPDLSNASDSGSSNSDNITNITTPTFTGTAEVGATVRLYSGSTEIGSTTASTGNWSITSSTLGEGSHTITATATDSLPSTSAPSAGLDITIDTSAPSISEVTAVSSPTGNPSYVFNSNESGILAVGGSCGSSREGAISSGDISVDLTQPDNSTALTTGTYSDCTIDVGDLAGNASNTLNINSFDVDADAPTGYSVSFDDSSIDASETSSSTFTISNAELNSNYNYTVSSSRGGSDVTGNGTISTTTQQVNIAELNGLNDGTLTLSVTLTDSANNTGNPATDTTTLDAKREEIQFFVIDNTSAEAGTNNTAQFSVQLTSQPIADVVISLVSDNTNEGDISTPAGKSLTFTGSDWNQPQNVIVTGVDDSSADGNLGYNIDLSAASSDNLFDAKTAQVNLINSDNDSAGVSITQIDMTTSEAGETATFSVVLNSLPSDTVSLNFLSDNNSEGMVSEPASKSLEFTTDNWNSEQFVTVSGVDDSAVDGDINYNISISATTNDGDYMTYSGSVGLTNKDDDSSGITISTSDNTSGEDTSTATFTVVLNSQPSADVTIDLSSSDSTEGDITTPASKSLTFTNSDWDQTQTVIVTGVDDNLYDKDINYHIILNSSSGDANYDQLFRTLLLTNSDNDDQDGDGYAAIPIGGDCDDNNANVNPGATEIADNGLDDDCVGGDLTTSTPTPPTPTATPSPSPTPTATPSPSPTATPTTSPVPTTTPVPTPVPTATPSPTITVTPVPTATPVPTTTPVATTTPVPSITPTPTSEPEPTASPLPSSSPAPLPPAVDLSDSNVLEQIEDSLTGGSENFDLNIEQDSNSGNVQANLGETRFEMRPIDVQPAPVGSTPGMTISSDGQVQMITNEGTLVTFTALPHEVDNLISVLNTLNLNIQQQDANGTIRVTFTNLRRDNHYWYVGRAAYERIPAESGAVPGLFHNAHPELLNTILHVHYFYEGDILYRQILYPTPANWPELKAFLNNFGATSIKPEGYIHTKVGNVTYRALMDYIVTPSTQGNGQLQYQAIGDSNGDNLPDYLITYANGNQQILYSLPSMSE